MSIESTIRALAAQGVIPGVGTALAPARGDIAGKLLGAVRDEVPAYRESSNPDVAPELGDHIEALVGQVVAILGGARRPDFDFARTHAERRASQRFPLEALLHTYRSIHKTLFATIRDAAIGAAPETAHVRRVVAAAADFTIEFIDTVSTLATSTYVSHTRMLAEAESDRRAELLTMLLQGYDESDSRAAQLLRRAGYLEQRQSYCVVAARSVNADEMRNAARAQRMADAVGDALARTSLRLLVGVRDKLVIAVVSGTRRQSGWTAPQSSLAGRLLPALRLVGPAALIGVSNDVPATSHVPRAAAEARLALDLANVAERVKPYSSVALRQLLVARAQDNLRAALPAWTADFEVADRRAEGRLAATLQAYADADMNVQRAAKQLGVHPNTIYARARRVEDLTGLNLLAYHDLTELLLAVEANTVNRS